MLADADDPNAGLLTVANGREVHIRPDELIYTGEAKFRWPGGREYDGEFVDGQPDGKGREHSPGGARYQGHWLRGRYHGVGVLKLPDGSRYEGDFNAGQRAGLGNYVGSTGSYDGEWEANAPHGQGKFDYPDGSHYEGSWNGGRRSGWGTYERNQSAYEGDWINDVPHGFGTASDRTGYGYDGSWQAGERDGYGNTSTRAGIAYEGTWVGGQRHGYGMQVRPNGARYLGEWRNDSRWGQGRVTDPDGSSHEGYWENNTPLGPGTRHTPEGVEITGTWNGDFVSSGIITLPNGHDYAGNLYDRGNKAINKRFLAWLTTTAEQGDPYAQLLMGEAYQRFQQPVPDDAIASGWYGRAAAAGITEAQYRLALLNLEVDAPGRTARALEWLLRASEEGHAEANVLLGSYYQTGTHVTRNHKRAAAYYEAAVQAGSVMARNNLAWLLATSRRETLRDGRRAIELAEPIAILYNDWGYLDTLAAALAESGDYQGAVQTQERAMQLAQGEADPGEFAQMQQRLDLFKQGQPYRE